MQKRGKWWRSIVAAFPRFKKRHAQVSKNDGLSKESPLPYSENPSTAALPNLSRNSRHPVQEELVPKPLRLRCSRNLPTKGAQPSSRYPQDPVEDGPSSELSQPPIRILTIMVTPVSSDIDRCATSDSLVPLRDSVEFALLCEIELVLVRNADSLLGFRPRRLVNHTEIVMVHPHMSYDQLVNRVCDSMAGVARSMKPPIVLNENTISELYFRWPRCTRPIYTPSDRYQSNGGKTETKIINIKIKRDNRPAVLDLLRRRCGKDALIVSVNIMPRPGDYFRIPLAFQDITADTELEQARAPEMDGQHKYIVYYNCEMQGFCNQAPSWVYRASRRIVYFFIRRHSQTSEAGF